MKKYINTQKEENNNNEKSILQRLEDSYMKSNVYILPSDISSPRISSLGSNVSIYGSSCGNTNFDIDEKAESANISNSNSNIDEKESNVFDLNSNYLVNRISEERNVADPICNVCCDDRNGAIYSTENYRIIGGRYAGENSNCTSRYSLRYRSREGRSRGRRSRPRSMKILSLRAVFEVGSKFCIVL